MKYVYVSTPGNRMEIRTPGNFTMADIKQEFIDQTAEMIIRKSTYPNGFEITMTQSPGFTSFETNRPLQSAGDGLFIAPTDT
jgi:hypothetical protein